MDFRSSLLPSSGLDTSVKSATRSAIPRPNPASIRCLYCIHVSSITSCRIAAAIPCEYDFPDVDGIINPDNIKVKYTPTGGGDEEEFTRRDDLGSCTGGNDFYFDDNDDPTKLFLCGGACTTVQDDGGDIKLDFGCLGS